MDVCVFSKHFQSLDADGLGQAMKELGVPGVDLTVRRGGHVDPEQVADSLPAVQATLAKHDVKVTMLTTSIMSVDQPNTQAIIETAGKAGVGYVKLGYWHYKGFGNLKSQEAEIRAALNDLAPMLKENGVQAGFHTHSGHYMGCNANFVMRIIEDCDPEAIGVYYDAGHCTLEGGEGGWLMGLDLCSERLIMVAVKDLAFFRTGSADSSHKGWFWLTVPFDAGPVDWPLFIQCLKAIDFKGPVSFHCEYQGEHSWRDLNVEQVAGQAKKDLAYWNRLVQG